jgi:Zn-dependent protease/CBS domain-containing protein
MRGAIRLGRILGIPIGINYTWFVALWLLTWSLARSYYPTTFPGFPQTTYFTMGLISAVLLFASVLVHELGHAVAARRYGIRTRSIILFLFGGVAQIGREPPTPASELIVAVAGPVTSLGLGGLCWLLGRVTAGSALGAIIGYLAWINAVLAVFNLVPGFPLDGGRMLRALLWRVFGNLERATRIAARVGQIIALGLIGLGVLGVFTGNVTGGVWLVLIGWFMDTGAQAGYQQVLLRESLGDVHVGDIMSREVHTVDPNVTLEQLVTDYFLPYKHGGFPVVWGDRLLGIITLHDVKEVPKEHRATSTVREAMTPLARLRTVRPGTSAYDAFTRMAQDAIGRLLVVDDDGELAGILTRSDLLHVLRIRTELEEMA